MPGDDDPLYVLARRVLLDALVALEAHRDAVILVGAQAIYLHVGEADLAVAPFTTDGDIALDSDALADAPALAAVMKAAGFLPMGADRIGTWVGADGVPIDLMVPEIQGGTGRRGARLGAHGNNVARKARGLEAALLDHAPMDVSALDPADDRMLTVLVAGPTALLVAKLHKLHERQGDPGRLNDKDAHDILRLLRDIPMERLIDTVRSLLVEGRARDVTRAALSHVEALSGAPDALGARMAVRNVGRLEDPEFVAASCTLLAGELIAAVEDASA